MGNIYVLAALCLVCCSKEEQREPQEYYDNIGIINGQRCLESQFPASVEILVDALVDMSPMGLKHVRSPICGGTLIGPRVVLTAAHCLKESGITHGFGKILKLRFAVISGPELEVFKRTKKIPGHAVYASAWKTHEEFVEASTEQVGLNKRNDIALLFLSRTLEIEPVKLLQAQERVDLAVGSTVGIVGWGQQKIEPEEIEPIRVNKICAQTKVNQLGEFEMQIGSDSNSARKCFGDSGGATYLTLPNGEQRLIGITSRSYDSNGCEKGGIDTRVDAYLNWIEASMNVVE